MAILSIGQITITDLNDARVASLYLEGNQAKIQAYTGENNKWSPDYTVNNLTITPHWFFGPSEVELTASQVSYEGSTGGTQNGINYIISSNLPKGTSVIVKVAVSGVKDDITGLTSDPLEATFEVTCLESGAPGSAGENGKTYGIISNGRNIFTNNNQTPIELTSYIYDGGLDVTGKTAYSWTIIPTNAEFDKLTTKATQSVTITRAMVDSAATVQCRMTYNGKTYYATIPIYDKVDPISVTILSSAGDKFTNSQIKTTLTAKLYSASGEEDAGGTEYTYIWKLHDREGNSKNWPANSDRKQDVALSTLSGKSIYVDSNDIDSKAIITVEITSK